jgi:hypothetical protein
VRARPFGPDPRHDVPREDASTVRSHGAGVGRKGAAGAKDPLSSPPTKHGVRGNASMRLLFGEVSRVFTTRTSNSPGFLVKETPRGRKRKTPPEHRLGRGSTSNTTMRSPHRPPQAAAHTPSVSAESAAGVYIGAKYRVPVVITLSRRVARADRPRRGGSMILRWDEVKRNSCGGGACGCAPCLRNARHCAPMRPR